MELIKIEQKEIGAESVQTVNARELHAFLESKQDFSTWIKNRIDQYNFIEGQDFVRLHKKMEANNATQIDYHVSIDMAKELSMVERNEKGKQARQYFLACEKRLKEVVPASHFQIPQTLPEALRLAADLAEKNAEQAAVIEQQKPAVEFVGRYVEAKQSQCLTDVAKIIGWKPRAFTKRLEQDDIIFHRGVWLPRQEQIEAGRFEVKTGEEKGFAFRQTRVTPKGITWLAKKYGESVTAH